MTSICMETIKKKSSLELECKKSGFSKDLAAVLQRKLFMFLLLISNYKAACPISAF